MSERDPYDASGRLELTPAEVRRLQRFLNEGREQKLAVDGLLGPGTKTVAFDLFREGPVGLDDGMMWLLQAAAMTDGPAPGLDWRIPPVWIFYSNSGLDAEWVARLEPGATIFWIHGRFPRGGAYKRRLRAGDTVLILVGQAFVASGILLADERLRLVDPAGRVRRPVRILDRYPTPFARAELETELDGPAIRQGAVHPVSVQALGWFNRQRQRDGLEPLPYPPDALQAALGARPLAADLEANLDRTGIRPDRPSAERIGWSGPTWSEEPDEGAAEAPPDGPGPLEEAEPTADETADGGDDGAQAAPPDSPAAPPGSEADVQIPFVLDAPADNEDELERGPLALFLARRLHLIWCQVNGHAPGPDGRPTRPSPPDADTFIAHVDSPWGGGKSTFANFVARVLDPGDEVLSDRHFLRSSLAATMPTDQLKAVDLSAVFVPPYAEKAPDAWPGARRPWIVARYNAWREQYVQPPWWQIFLALHDATRRALWRDAMADLRAGLRRPRRIATGLATLGRWLGVHFERLGYQLWNSKLKSQLALVAVGALAAWLLWSRGMLRGDPKQIKEWLGLIVAILTIGGASAAAIVTALSQSLAPDLDFTAENKQIGVRDPIERFRRTFGRIVRATPRPILLIVDDLDRCEPQTVVEILRGFQTIIRSPRLFVLLLGDRAWIESAHDVYHKDRLSLCDEGTLGALYVQKVIQLSLRLPIMAAEARRRYARRVLGEGRPGVGGTKVAKVLRTLEKDADAIVATDRSIGHKEAALGDAAAKAASQLRGALTEADQAEVDAEIRRMVSAKIVAAAGADTAQQREVFNAITQLIDCLPNNPRQIKRIFMAFATYEQVGRRLFNYQLTPDGPDGERRARRWRQLAMWVTLAVEWPETWRALGRRPELLDAAFQPPGMREAHEKALMEGLTGAEQSGAAATLRRLRCDPVLVALLGGRAEGAGDSPDQDFARTRIETEAVYEFNRIIWEPGFPLQPALRP